MFKTRLISGIVLVIVLAACIFFGGWVFWALLLAVSLIGMYEIYKLESLERSPLYIIGAICTILYALSFRVVVLPTVFIPFLMFILLAVMYVLTYPKYNAKEIILAFFGFFYVPVFIFCLDLIRFQTQGGIYLIWLIFIASWGCDTGAYCVGCTLGKHKLAPILSPKKSIEGAVGGVVISAILGIIYALIFGSKMTIFSNPLLACAVISAVGAIFSQFGDLTASALKRNYDIKDYGTLIPGHGGIMDRFDSVIFVSPIIYGMIVFFSFL